LSFYPNSDINNPLTKHPKVNQLNITVLASLLGSCLEAVRGYRNPWLWSQGEF